MSIKLGMNDKVKVQVKPNTRAPGFTLVWMNSDDDSFSSSGMWLFNISRENRKWKKENRPPPAGFLMGMSIKLGMNDKVKVQVKPTTRAKGAGSRLMCRSKMWTTPDLIDLPNLAAYQARKKGESGTHSLL